MMKRILTLAIAAILVVAFAIPAFAAPKVEIVGGSVSFSANWNKADGFTPVNWSWSMVGLNFGFTADNFAFNVETTGAFLPTYWDFSLALPYMELSGTSNDGYGNNYVMLASDAKFEELAGFNWYVQEYFWEEYIVDANGDYIDMNPATPELDHGIVNEGQFWAGVGTTIGPVSLNLDYANDNDYSNYEDTNPMEHYLGLGAAYDGVVDVTVNVGKEITSDFDDIGADLTVAFPIIDGLTGKFYAGYAMENACEMAWIANSFVTNFDLRYKNEAANGQFFVNYNNTSKFDGDSKFRAVAEYVSNGAVSHTSGGTLSDNYAESAWNTRFNWVRNNSGNEFAARAAFNYTLGANTYDVAAWAMFAPDFAPVVASLKATYDGTDFGIYNWIGVRINEDIHFALYDRYVNNDFEIDSAIVYKRDGVTFKLTGANLLDWNTTGSVSAYVGIAF